MTVACQRSASVPPSSPQTAAELPAPALDRSGTADPGDVAEGVVLKPEQMEKSGITVQAAQAATHAAETTGYALVVPRESIAQSVAELTTAAAVQRQSRAALARSQRLAGTPGALPMESQESAQRQAAADDAALLLAQRRVSATLGTQAPWREHPGGPLLSSLAAGDSKLVRVTFPLGTFTGAAPSRLRFTHLGEEQGARSVQSQLVWEAPADPALPGRSLFAILKGNEAADGERLVAHAPVASAQAGVIVPYSAAVMSGGKYWCYIQTKPGVFVRSEITTDAPTDTGYFIPQGIAPGAQLVVTAAGQLLARQTHPDAGAAD